MRASRLVMVIALVAVMVPFGAPTASAGPGEVDTYWVDVATGSDANAGTAAEPFKTITHAASVADQLDTIMVQPGTYGGPGETWPISFAGESLVSVDGATATTIMGDGAHQLLLFTGWTDGDRLEGFTISTGGMPSTAPAVQVTISAPTSAAAAPSVGYCDFANNTGGSTGGALYVNVQTAADLVVEGNEFSANAAVRGGALYGVAYGTLTLTGNEFTNNTATYGGGAELYSSGAGAILVDNNIFSGNAAGNTAGAINWSSGSLTQTHSVWGNRFTNNSAPIGGALYLYQVNLAITGNLAVANVASSGGQSGFAYLENSDVLAESNYLAQHTGTNNGSVWTVDPSSTLTETNDTVVGSSGSSYALYADEVATVAVTNCIYWNPATPVEMAHVDAVAYTCSADDAAALASGGSTVGAGMVYADPLLDAADMPALLPASPCIEAGSRTDWVDFDFFGTAVPQDADGDRVAVADIGCYEKPGVALPVLVPVWRFYNAALGTHFYTASATEKANVIANLSHIYTLEGEAYRMYPAGNATPLHRFYRPATATHFYTASATEKANVIANLSHVYTYEGVAYNVSTVRPAFGVQVYRFFNTRNGTHFYTASLSERNTVIANLSHIYNYEGPAFYVAQ